MKVHLEKLESFKDELSLDVYSKKNILLISRITSYITRHPELMDFISYQDEYANYFISEKFEPNMILSTIDVLIYEIKKNNPDM